MALACLAGRLVPLEHCGGRLGLRHRRHLHVGDLPSEGAELAAHLGELGAQLNIELVELGGRCGVDEPEVD
eukprot:15476498-Alexandrium_andersonii.AAC.1